MAQQEYRLGPPYYYEPGMFASSEANLERAEAYSPNAERNSEKHHRFLTLNPFSSWMASMQMSRAKQEAQLKAHLEQTEVWSPPPPPPTACHPRPRLPSMFAAQRLPCLAGGCQCPEALLVRLRNLILIALLTTPPATAAHTSQQPPPRRALRDPELLHPSVPFVAPSYFLPVGARCRHALCGIVTQDAAGDQRRRASDAQEEHGAQCAQRVPRGQAHQGELR